MLIEQIIEFELGGGGFPGCTCIPTTDYFYDKAIIYKERSLRGLLFTAKILEEAMIVTRGGVEDIRLEAKAKNTKKFRGQGQTLSRPRTNDTGASVLPKKKLFKNFFQAISKKDLKIVFSGEKGLQKTFFRRSPLEENKRRSSQIFCEVSGVFQQNFNGSKNSAVLEPRTGQFSRN